MSFSDGHEIAKALASEITARLDLPAAAVYFVPREAKSNELQVAVAYTGETTEVEDRASNRKQYTIEVAVQQKLLKRDDPEEFDALLQICDSIKGLFEEEDDTGADLNRGSLREAILGNAIWMATRHEPLWFDDHVENHKQFSAVPTFTFQRVT